LRAAILRLQLNERFSYDAAQSLFFNNFEEHEVAGLEDVETIRTEVEARLHDASVKPHSVVNYDNFAIRPEVLDAYAVRWYFRFQLSSHATCFIRGANIADEPTRAARDEYFDRAAKSSTSRPRLAAQLHSGFWDPDFPIGAAGVRFTPAWEPLLRRPCQCRYGHRNPPMGQSNSRSTPDHQKTAD
jgi:hypothetical protein